MPKSNSKPATASTATAAGSNPTSDTKDFKQGGKQSSAAETITVEIDEKAKHDRAIGFVARLSIDPHSQPSKTALISLCKDHAFDPLQTFEYRSSVWETAIERSSSQSLAIMILHTTHQYPPDLHVRLNRGKNKFSFAEKISELCRDGERFRKVLGILIHDDQQDATVHDAIIKYFSANINFSVPDFGQQTKLLILLAKKNALTSLKTQPTNFELGSYLLALVELIKEDFVVEAINLMNHAHGIFKNEGRWLEEETSAKEAIIIKAAQKYVVQKSANQQQAIENLQNTLLLIPDLDRELTSAAFSALGANIEAVMGLNTALVGIGRKELVCSAEQHQKYLEQLAGDFYDRCITAKAITEVSDSGDHKHTATSAGLPAIASPVQSGLKFTREQQSEIHLLLFSFHAQLKKNHPKDYDTFRGKVSSKLTGLLSQIEGLLGEKSDSNDQKNDLENKVHAFGKLCAAYYPVPVYKDQFVKLLNQIIDSGKLVLARVMLMYGGDLLPAIEQIPALTKKLVTSQSAPAASVSAAQEDAKHAVKAESIFDYAFVAEFDVFYVNRKANIKKVGEKVDTEKTAQQRKFAECLLLELIAVETDHNILREKFLKNDGNLSVPLLRERQPDRVFDFFTFGGGNSKSWNIVKARAQQKAIDLVVEQSKALVAIINDVNNYEHTVNTLFKKLNEIKETIGSLSIKEDKKAVATVNAALKIIDSAFDSLQITFQERLIQCIAREMSVSVKGIEPDAKPGHLKQQILQCCSTDSKVSAVLRLQREIVQRLNVRVPVAASSATAAAPQNKI